MTWHSTDIEDARETPLAPLLKACGYLVSELRSGAFLVEELGDLVIRGHYWFWKSKHLKGNPIDFFMVVEGRTFHQAMTLITETVAAGEDNDDSTGRVTPGSPSASRDTVGQETEDTDTDLLEDLPF